jgi:hypothetical protein
MKVIALLSILLASPALAGGFKAPEGCQTVMTIQSRGCYVANYYTCEAGPGNLWRVDHDQEGAFYLSMIDNETQWIESTDLGDGTVQTLDPSPMDPASASGLLATGYDSFIFSLSKDNGEHSNVRGFDRLTGETETIDGVALERTEYEYTETDDEGNILRQSRGREYILREPRTFLSGTSEWWDGENWLPLEGHPVDFAFPDDKGFEASQPIFDCDAVMSMAPLVPPDAALLAKVKG